MILGFRRWPGLFVSLACGASFAGSCSDAESAEVFPPVEIADPGPVPAPFAPVTVEPVPAAKGMGASLDVRVWGRSYHFVRGPLPSRLTSQGVDLWLREPRFLAGVSESPSDVAWEATRVDRSSPAQVVLRSEGSAGGISLAARTTVEFDGMIRVDLSLSAPEGGKIGAFAYELVLPTAVARTFSHHLEYDYTTMRADKAQLVSSSGTFPSAPRSFAFVPTLFVGNRDVGLEWWSESNAGWKPDPAGPLTLRTDGTAALFRVAPIGRSVHLVNGSRWAHTFAIFPAPAREAPPRWRSNRFGSPSQARRFDRGTGNRPVWIAFPGHFDARWHGLPESKRSSRQQQLRADLAKDGIAYIPYGKLTVAPSLHPRAMENAEAWASTRRLFTQAGSGQRTFLETQGWNPGTPYSYAACVEAPGYLHWMLQENLSALRAEHLDGLYFDVASIREPCRKEPYVHHPEQEQRWSYLAMREFFKQLYTEVKAQKPEALIAIHTQGQPRALAAFLDYMFVGEALNELFRGGHSHEAMERNAQLYDPDYFALPPAFLDALLLPRVGGVTALIPQVRRWSIARDPKLQARLTRELLAITLVNDTAVWLTNSDPETRIAVYRAIDRFGSLDDARLEPWWRGSPSIGVDPRLRVTAYVAPGRALLVVSNWEKAPIETSVRVDANALGLPGSLRLRDLENPKEKRQRLRDGSFRTRIPGRDFRLYLLESLERDPDAGPAAPRLSTR